MHRAITKLSAIFALIFGATCTNAADQRIEEAFELINKGEAAYSEGKYEEAAQLYLASMQIQGTVRAASNLCNLFLYGQGVPQSYGTALELCGAAAEREYPSALVMLGEMHLMGKGVEPNREKALSYYRQGADLGHLHGQYVLGLELAEESPEEALKYLKLAYEGGYVRAMAPLMELQARVNK